MQNARPATRPKLDVVGTLLAAVGLFGVVYGFAHAETSGWTDSITVASLALGVVLIAAFLWSQTRIAHPLLPLRIITDPARGGAYLAVAVSGIAIFGVFLFVTYYLQLVKGFSPVSSGLAFLPMMGRHRHGVEHVDHRAAAAGRPAGAHHQRHALRCRLDDHAVAADAVQQLPPPWCFRR